MNERHRAWVEHDAARADADRLHHGAHPPPPPPPPPPPNHGRPIRQTKAELRSELLNARYALTAERDAARADADRLAAMLELIVPKIIFLHMQICTGDCLCFTQEADAVAALDAHEDEVAKR